MVAPRSIGIILGFILLLSLVACNTPLLPAAPNADGVQAPITEETGNDTPSPTPLPAMPGGPTPTPGVLYKSEPTMPERTPVRWYVGLGAGSDASVLEAQATLVEEYNASQDEIELVLEIVSNNIAAQELRTRIDSGQAPDLVGPIGTYGRASFATEWLDLTPYIEKYQYDLSDFDPALVDFYRLNEGLVSIPFAVFPSFIIINTDAFDKAGLPYPPQEYGRPYIDETGTEREWNMETLRDVAMKLTLDANGNNALSPDFDPNAIEQFGYGTLKTDLRGRLTLFGAGNFVDEFGQATMPEQWRTALDWYYKGMWQDHFYPNAIYGSSAMLNQGEWFASGNLAMGHAHLWLVSCCIGPYEGQWTTAVVPSHNGVTTAKLHADTFTILRAGQNQEAAFQVMTYLLGEKAGELATIYGGMPARKSLQPDYFAALGEQFAGQNINWNTVVAGLSYPDIPNHEEALPAYIEARERYTNFAELIDSRPDLDLDAEVATLMADLQAIFETTR